MVARDSEIARPAAPGVQAGSGPMTVEGRWGPPAARTAILSGAVALPLLNAVGIGLWVAVNTGLIPGVQAFDPYPFHLLTLVASLEAVLLSVAVLVRLGRVEARAEERSRLALRAGILVEDKVVEVARMVEEIEEKLRRTT